VPLPSGTWMTICGSWSCLVQSLPSHSLACAKRVMAVRSWPHLCSNKLVATSQVPSSLGQNPNLALSSLAVRNLSSCLALWICFSPFRWSWPALVFENPGPMVAWNGTHQNASDPTSSGVRGRTDETPFDTFFHALPT